MSGPRPPIAWAIATETGGLRILVCPLCGETHEPQEQPCTGYQLELAPEALRPHLTDLQALPQPWLLIDGRGCVASTHETLSEAHAGLIAGIATDPWLHLRNARIDKLEVLTRAYFKAQQTVVIRN